MGVRHVLAKFGQRRFMRDLVMDGEILVRQLLYYTDLENKAQGDPDEGLMMRYSGENPTLKVTAQIAGKTLPLDIIDMRVPGPYRRHGVYCMYGIEVPDDISRELPFSAVQKLVEDKQLADFGYDTLVLFRNSPEFVRRLKRAARKLHYEIKNGPIEYVPSSHCGDMGPFRKLDSYKYQSESRFLTTQPIPGDIKLKLGPLWDIVVGWIDLNEARGK